MHVFLLMLIFVCFQGVHIIFGFTMKGEILDFIALMPGMCKSLLISQYFAFQIYLISGKHRWKLS